MATYKTWSTVRAEAIAAGTLNEAEAARHRDDIRAEQRAYRLAEIRQDQGVTQGELGEIMGVAQPRVSAIERGDLATAGVGTLESYVEALGGHLRLVADFGDMSLTVRG